ncbi:hypothetical protein ACQKIE_16265 [Luteibacter sp. NPDC031894]|uniref:hypothetical protein n=1 Tax=Luteibacter sp. NPDC031894 TaxID=3390572 RepID=UPI003CFE5F0E
MPIKPENRDRYPANWSTEIRPAILKRAGDRCERCKAKNGHVICREMSGATYMVDDGYVFSSENGDCLGRARVTDYPAGRYITVVLTIAHLDHQPESCDPNNLRAWCQRCHLAYDKDHHAVTRRATIAARRASGDLFQEAG